MCYRDRAIEALKQAGIRTTYGGYPTYAVAVATGGQCLSGADIRGKARAYAGHYARTWNRVLRALEKAAVAHEERGLHGRRYLVDEETGREV